MKKLIPLLTLALASMPLIADEDLMAKLDSNNDGLISIEEAAEDASLSNMFTALDTDQDGYLSSNELANINLKNEE